MSLGTVLCFMASLCTVLKAILLTQSREESCQQGRYFDHFQVFKIFMFKVGRRGHNHRQATLDSVSANIGRVGLWRQDGQSGVPPSLGDTGLEKTLYLYPHF